MTTKIFGISLPALVQDIKPGMLVVGTTRDDQLRVTSLAFQGEREVLLAVFNHSGNNPDVPRVIDIGLLQDTMAIIPGDREFVAISDPFAVPKRSRGANEGLVVTTTGKVGLNVVNDDFGRQQYLTLDFDSGLPLETPGTWSKLPPARLYVREAGRDGAFEVPLAR